MSAVYTDRFPGTGLDFTNLAGGVPGFVNDATWDTGVKKTTNTFLGNEGRAELDPTLSGPLDLSTLAEFTIAHAVETWGTPIGANNYFLDWANQSRNQFYTGGAGGTEDDVNPATGTVLDNFDDAGYPAAGFHQVIIITYVDATGDAHFYINDVELPNPSGSGTGVVAPNNNITIGAQSGGAFACRAYHAGTALWSRVLNGAERTALTNITGGQAHFLDLTNF